MGTVGSHGRAGGRKKWADFGPGTLILIKFRRNPEISSTPYFESNFEKSGSKPSGRPRQRAAVRQDPLQWRARRAGPLCKRSTVGAQHWLGADDGPSRGVDVAPHLPVGLGSSLRPSACGARRPSTTSAALRVSQRRSPPPASQRLLHTRAESGLGVGSCPRLALRAAWSWLPPSRMCTSSRRSSRSSTSRDAGQDYSACVCMVVAVVYSTPE